jgi:hypothetical protein
VILQLIERYVAVDEATTPRSRGSTGSSAKPPIGLPSTR